MNGIDFIVRDRSGWVPPVPPAAPFVHPEFIIPAAPGPGEPLTVVHIDFIRDMEGAVTVRELQRTFGISRGTIHNIQSGQRGAGQRIVARQNRQGHRTTGTA